MKNQSTQRTKAFAPKLSKLTMMTAAALGAAAPVATANDDKQFVLRVPIESKITIPQWIIINYANTPWVNFGVPTNCAEWAPDVSTIDWDRAFQQVRQCAQTQVRDVTPILYNPVLKTTKNGETYEASQIVPVTQYQAAIGRRDFIDGERPDAWSAWSDVGGHFNCAPWTPSPDTVNLYDAFEQSRDCEQNQARDRQVYHVWASGKETAKRIDTESRTVVEIEKQAAQGAKDYIDGERIATWSSWMPSGARYSCDPWSPTPDTVNLNASFEQTRSCEQNYSRERGIYDVWRSGKETLNRTEPGAKTETVLETQAATGTKDFVTSEKKDAWSDWAAVNDSGHTAWSPSVDSVNLGEAFTQSRNYQQAQSRTRKVHQVWASGKVTFLRNDDEDRVVTLTESRPATGTKDYIASTSTEAWSVWAPVKDHTHTTWSPAVTTVNLGESFTQSRSYQQDQARSRNVNDVWASGKTTLNRTENDAQTVTLNESRPATGTKDYIASTRNGNWAAWSPTKDHSHSAWSPTKDTVNLNQAFTQSRSYKQDQTRTRQVYNVWASGKETLLRTESGAQTIDLSEERTVTGTKDYIASTRDGAWSAWTNVKDHSHTAWSPSLDTVNLGATVTQSRDYKRDQSRTRTIYNVWASGKETTLRSESDARTLALDESRSGTGTKNYITGKTAGAWSAWSTMSRSGHTAWSPAASAVNLNEAFTQTRSFNELQSRTRTVYDVWADGTKTVDTGLEDGQEMATRTISGSESRSATGTKDYITTTSNGAWSAWTDVSRSGHSAWSPTPTTVNLGESFTQSRSYSQLQTRSRTIYNVWASGKKTAKTTESANQTISETESRSATGTKDYITGTSAGAWSGWSNTGGAYSHSAWSPVASTVNLGTTFTQSRSYKQNQTRSRTIYNVWASGSKTAKTTESGTQTLTLSESRSDVGEKDYMTATTPGAWSAWTDVSRSGHSAWSPAPTTVNLGASFTQSRSYSQLQTRSRTIYNVWASGKKTAKTTESANQTISETESRSATGTKDYITGTSAGAWSGWSNTGGAYSHSAWSPVASAVNLGTTFTQSRSYKQNQTRSRTIYNVWASGSKTAKTTESGTQTLTLSESRSDVGEKDYITATTPGAWSAWSNDGSAHSYTAYSPSTATVNYGVSFTQSRSYVQPLKRTRNIYNVWKSGKQTVKSTEADTTNDSRTQSRTATGTKDYVNGTTYGSWSGWSNTGSAYGYSAWNASCGSYNLGTTFTRTRTYKQDQVRTRTVYQTYASGKTPTATGTQTGTQTLTPTQTDSEAGCKDYITTTTTGAWSGWSNNGSAYGYSAYSPSTSTVNLGSAFTQTRSYTQPVKRTRTIYNVWKSGKQTVKATETGTSTETRTQSRSATGSKDYITGTSNGAYGSWSNSGSAHSYTAYSPATSTVNYGVSFTQTRSYKQPQKRTRTVYNVWKSGAKTAKTTQDETRTVTNSQTRAATGTKDYDTGGASYSGWSTWVYKTTHSWTAYTPADNTVNYGTSFTATRSYKEHQWRTRDVYNVFASGATTYSHTETEKRDIDRTDSATRTGTRDYVVNITTSYGTWSSWSNTSCTEWKVPTDIVPQGEQFTQTRDCDQRRTRSYTRYENWAKGSRVQVASGTSSATQTVEESRTAYGTSNDFCLDQYGKPYAFCL